MEEKNEKMELIDFDDKFTQVLNDWVEKNQTKFANADEMEAARMDDVVKSLDQEVQALEDFISSEE